MFMVTTRKYLFTCSVDSNPKFIEDRLPTPYKGIVGVVRGGARCKFVGVVVVVVSFEFLASSMFGCYHGVLGPNHGTDAAQGGL